MIEQILGNMFAQTFMKGLSMHLDSEQFSDFEFRCDGHHFKVHKLIVSSHSSVLMKACTGSFKEALENSMDFTDEDPTYVKALIDGMYRLDYLDNKDIAGADVNPFIFNANMYAVAEKYDIPALKLLAAQKFKDHKARLSVVASLSPFEAPGDQPELLSFAEAIRIIFTSTPTSDKLLREIALDMTMDHVDKLLDSEPFCEAVEDAPGFGIRIASRYKKHIAERVRQTYRCLRCTAKWSPAQVSTYYGYCPACGNRSAASEGLMTDQRNVVNPSV